MAKRAKRRNGLREIPEELWQLIEPILPPDKSPGSNGRPAVANRTILNGILFVLRTGCQWKMVPREYSSGSTCHLRFQTWVKAGLFKKMWRKCLRHYDDLRGIEWRFQSMDSATVSAPVKGATKLEKTRPIAGNWAPNDTCSRMPTAFRWPSPFPAPTDTT